MKLEFLISDKHILTMDVNTQTKKTKVLYAANNLATDAILLHDERTYTGLERRLQYLMDNTKPLPELIQIIKENNINTPIQYNLNINVIE